MTAPAPHVSRIPKDRHSRWVPLYGATFMLQCLCALVRGFVIGTPLYVLLKAANIIFPGTWDALHIPLDVLAILIAYGPLPWSLAALIYPVPHGWFWQQQAGGRPPSRREALAYDDAVDELLSSHPEVRRPKHWFVLDDPTLNGGVLGDTLALNRGMIDSAYLEAVIAHELGHLNSIDGRLTLALWRFTVLPGRFSELPRYGGVLAHLRWVLFMLADGTMAMYATRVLWSNYFRWREYVADRYASMLGQGEEFATFLEDDALIHDFPIPWPWLSDASHPPVELRIDRLRQYEEDQAQLADSLGTAEAPADDDAE